MSKIPVFVSHSSGDKRAVRVIARYLEARGYAPWVDETGIAGGSLWQSELLNALRSTRIVVLVVSISAMRSTWVVREIQAAESLGRRVVPVVVEDAPYPDELRLILGRVQRLDLTGWNDPDRRDHQLRRLDLALIDVLRRTSDSPAPAGRGLIAAGNVIRAIGAVGVVIGFALFVYLGVTGIGDFPARGEIPAPVYGWGLFAISALIAGTGESLRRAGLKKGI